MNIGHSGISCGAAHGVFIRQPDNTYVVRLILVLALFVLTGLFSWTPVFAQNSARSFSSAGTFDGTMADPQKALKTLGFYRGDIDGVIGPQTKAAIRAYFRAIGHRGNFQGTTYGDLLFTGWIVETSTRSLRQARTLLPELRIAIKNELAAENAFRAGDFRKAVRRYSQVQSVYTRIFGPYHRTSLGILYRKAQAMMPLGMYGEASKVVYDAFRGSRRINGDASDLTRQALEILRRLYAQQGRYRDAEDIIRDFYASRARVGQSPQLILEELGIVVLAQGKAGEAAGIFEKLYKERVVRANAGDLVLLDFERDLSKALLALGRLDEGIIHAENAYRSAKIYDRNHRSETGWNPQLADDVEIELVQAYLTAHRVEKATNLISQSRTFNTLVTRNYTYRSINAARIFAQYQLATGNTRLAIQYARSAMDGLRAKGATASTEFLRLRSIHAKALIAEGRVDEAKLELDDLISNIPDFFAANPDTYQTERQRIKDLLEDYFKVLQTLPLSDDERARQSLAVQGWWAYGQLDIAASDLAARSATKSPVLATKIRAFQDNREQLTALRNAFVQKVGASENLPRQSSQTDVEITDLVGRQSRLLAEIEAADTNTALVLRPRLATIDDIQSALSPDTSMAVFSVGRQNLYVWTVTNTSISWRVKKIPSIEISTRIDTLRSALDVQAPAAAVIPVGKCAVISKFGYLSKKPFNACLSNALFHLFFDDVNIDFKKHLIVVPDGALETLPFSMLVTGFSPAEQPEWLIDRVSIATSPTSSSLAALAGAENNRTKQVAPLSYAGFAPEVFDGVYDNYAAARALGTLPATVDEVSAIAAFFGSQTGSVITGASASEANLKAMDLSNVPVISFATHGLTAEETDFVTAGRITEPSLFMSGPGSTSEDGILTASEAALLKLDADWVLLSGCNTAAGRSEQADGLTGLAQAFIFAGARSLLVSHWSVDDIAAQLIMTGTMDNIARDQSINKATALQLSIQRLKSRPEYQHPFFWAPFELVGSSAPSKSVRAPAKTFALAALAAPVSTRKFSLGPAPAARGAPAKLVQAPIFVPKFFLNETPEPAPNPAPVVVPEVADDLATPATPVSEKSLALSRQQRAEIQLRLGLLGFDPHGTDGSFGSNSRRAISAWQTARDIQPTGYLNRPQLTLLNKSSDARFASWQAENPNRAILRVPKRRRRKCTQVAFLRFCSN